MDYDQLLPNARAIPRDGILAERFRALSGSRTRADSVDGCRLWRLTCTFVAVRCWNSDENSTPDSCTPESVELPTNSPHVLILGMNRGIRHSQNLMDASIGSAL